MNRRPRVCRSRALAVVAIVVGAGSASTDASAGRIESLRAWLHGSMEFPNLTGMVRFHNPPQASPVMWLDTSRVEYRLKQRFVIWLARGGGRGYYAGQTDLLSGSSPAMVVAGSPKAVRHNISHANRITVTLVGLRRARRIELRSRRYPKSVANVLGNTVLSGRLKRVRTE